MLFIQKVEQFGNQFSEDYVKIMKLGTLEKVKEYINGINDQWRKILMADTYFSILQGKKVGSDFEHDQIA